MKTILRVLLAAVVMGLTQASGALSDAVQTSVNSAVATLNSTTTTKEQKDAAIASIKSLSSDNEEEAAAIVSAVLIAMGGENANQALVTQLLSEVLAAFGTNTTITEAIVLEAVRIAPILVSNIEVSVSGAFLSNPLQSLVGDNLVVGESIRDSGAGFSVPSGASDE
jgi:outer membrane murein-binding lipoprotein Lpp